MKRLFLLVAMVLFATVNICSAQKSKDVDAQVRRFIEFQMNDQLEEAAELADSMLTLYPTNADVLHLKASSLNDRGQVEEALEYQNLALKSWKKRGFYSKSALHFFSATYHYQLEDIESALIDIEQSIELLKKDEKIVYVNLLMLRARCYYYISEFESAYADLAKVLYTSDEDSDIEYALVGMCHIALEAENYERAILVAKALNEVSGVCHDSLHTLALAYRELGENHLAIDNAVLMLLIDSGDAESRELKYILLSDPEYSKQLIDKYAAEDPDHEYALEFITLYQLCHEYDSMIPLFKYLDEDRNSLLSNYATFSALAGKYDDAVAYVTELIANCPEDDIESRCYHLAMRNLYHIMMGAYDLSAADAQEIINLIPDSAFGYYLMGYSLDYMGDDAQALDYYNKCLSIDDENYTHAYLLRGEQYLKSGQTELAKRDFERVLELDTVAEDGSYRQFALHYLGRDEEAIEWMKEIIYSDPYDFDFYFTAACLYATMGEIYQSLDHLNIALMLGYNSKAEIENSDYLDPVRDTDVYRSMMDQYFGN